MVERKYPTVLVCVPCYRSVDPNPFIHFLVLAQETGKAELLGQYAVRWMVGGPRQKIVPVRETAANLAVNGGCSHLWFIDDDFVLPTGLLGRLLAHDVDIVAPLFFKDDPVEPLVFKADYRTGKFECWRDYPENSLFEVPGAVGSGCMLIAVRVLQAMQPPYFRKNPDPEIGEDLDFCQRARGLGFKIWCDSTCPVEQMGISAPVGVKQYKRPEPVDNRGVNWPKEESYNGEADLHRQFQGHTTGTIYN